MSINAPVYNNPQTVIVSVPVITQPYAAIQIQTCTESDEIRGVGDRIFLNEQYPAAGTLSTLERAFAHLAMVAAEDYYATQPQITADQMLSAIGSETNSNARRAVAGILSGHLHAKLQYTNPDAETIALRDWGTRLWRNHKIVAAKDES